MLDTYKNFKFLFATLYFVHNFKFFVLNKEASPDEPSLNQGKWDNNSRGAQLFIFNRIDFNHLGFYPIRSRLLNPFHRKAALTNIEGVAYYHEKASLGAIQYSDEAFQSTWQSQDSSK